MYSGLRLFKTAFQNTRRQICVSGVFLVAITFVLTVILYFAESRVDSNFTFWDAFIWPYEKYLGDPGKIVDEPVISPIAKIVGTLVGIMGVAIFAVPAGLIGSGLTDAMDEEKRNNEIDNYYKRMKKTFRRTVNKTLRAYLDTLPEGGGEKYKKLNFVPSRIPVSRMQIRQGFEFKDIYEVCEKYPEFRLKNLAEAMSSEEHAEDRFVVEHFPRNTVYGYSIDRQSKVTIVSTSSFAECGTGWFSYYLAKLGGFNYVSKDVEVDPDELDSFYNMSPEPLCNKQPKSFYNKEKKTKEDKAALELIEKKNNNRNAFLDDLRKLAKGEDSWVILITAHIKSSENQFDFHLANSKKDGSNSTISNEQQYEQLLQAFDQIMQSKYQLTSSLHSQRFPLTKNNLGNKLQRDGISKNTFVLRPSSDIINFQSNRLLLAFQIAMLLSEQLDNSKGITDDDVKDFKDSCFGYKEKKEDKDKNK